MEKKTHYVEVSERTYCCLYRIEHLNKLWSELADENHLTDQAQDAMNCVMNLLFDDLRECVSHGEIRL